MNDPQSNDNLDETSGTEAAATAAESTEPDPFVVLQNLQTENASLKDRLLRTLADMENMRRRTDKEVADSKLYGVTSFARDMLTFADNLHRALANVPEAVRQAADGNVQTFIQGVELTERDFHSRLARHGVRKIEPEGQKFDPNLHEALFEVPDETVPHGMVKQVVEQGFTIGDRVLRPAKVGISRGGPKGAVVQ